MGNSQSQNNNSIINKLQDVLNTNTEMFQSPSTELYGGYTVFNKGDKFTTKNGKSGTVLEKRAGLNVSGQSGTEYYQVVFDNGQSETMWPANDMVNTQEIERKKLEEDRKRKEADERKIEEERKRKEADERKREEERRKRESEDARKREEELKRKAAEDARKLEEERRKRESEERKREEELKRREAENARKLDEERRKREAEERKREEELKRREAEERKREEELKRKAAEDARKLEEERRKREADEAKKLEDERRKKETEDRQREATRKQKDELISQINKNNTLIQNYEEQIKSTADRIPGSPHAERLRSSDKIKEYENEKNKLDITNKQLQSKVDQIR